MEISIRSYDGLEVRFLKNKMSEKLATTEAEKVRSIESFNLHLQESPPSKRNERWRGMAEEELDVIGHEEVAR